MYTILPAQSLHNLHSHYITNFMAISKIPVELPEPEMTSQRTAVRYDYSDRYALRLWPYTGPLRRPGKIRSVTCECRSGHEVRGLLIHIRMKIRTSKTTISHSGNRNRFRKLIPSDVCSL